MTIEEMAKILDDCGNRKRCGVCRYSSYGNNTDYCEGHMIKYAGDFFRKYVEQIGDDGK